MNSTARQAAPNGPSWTIGNLGERLHTLRLRKDPWAGYGEAQQRLTAEMRRRLHGK